MSKNVDGTVVGLCLSRAASAPMEACASLSLRVGHGVEGDRYAEGRGHWSGWPDHEVTLVEIEDAKQAGVDALILRRNIITRGIDLTRLENAAFTVGEVLLFGVRPCSPCRHLDEVTGTEGLKARIRGGLRARVSRGGTVRVGDGVRAARDEEDLEPAVERPRSGTSF